MLRIVLVAAAILAVGSLGAAAQQKAAPSKAHGAGASCSRMTDAKARDECVRQAQQKDDSAKGKGSVAHGNAHAGGATSKGKHNK